MSSSVQQESEFGGGVMPKVGETPLTVVDIHHPVCFMVVGKCGQPEITTTCGNDLPCALGIIPSIVKVEATMSHVQHFPGLLRYRIH